MPRRKQANGTSGARPLLLLLLRSKPPTTTLRELLADPILGPHIPDLSLQELGGDGGGPSSSFGGASVGRTRAKTTPGRKATTSTRTTAGREDYDSRVFAAIKAAGGPASAEQLLPQVGGDPAQFRAATKRLLKAKKVRRSGKARGTKYAAT